MSALPDFTTADYWRDRHGTTYTASQMQRTARAYPHTVASFAPWTPLRTANDCASRIDPDKLAHVIEVAHRGRAAHSRTTNRAVAAAIIAALPELTKEEA